MKGDILLGKSTKIVIERAELVSESQKGNKDSVEKLISDIQTALYGENNLLPYVLTLCLDLCDRVEIPLGYREWINKELNGYDEYDEFKTEFETKFQFEEWMDKWASHRIIKSYIKTSFPSQEKRFLEIHPFEFDDILIAFPVAQIARMLQDVEGDHEFSIPLLNFGKERVDSLRNALAKYRVDIPLDLLVYYKATELVKVLNKDREKVLNLLKEVRQKLK